MTRNSYPVPSSFRDPAGFLFLRAGTLYRQVNISYRHNYEQLMKSGLYDALLDADLLVPHEEVDIEPPEPAGAFRVVKPKPVRFVSYPYEWCFSQLKDAALATLRIQRLCLDFGMSLKDCSAYNIQFERGKPVLIDTLSFEAYAEGKPWVAYRQFCQHFLAPLALMAYKDVRLSQLLRIYVDGLPLDLARALLPWRTWLNLSLLSHINLHARSQQHYADRAVSISKYKMGRLALLGLIESLETAIRSLRWQARGTEWAEYYDDTNYSSLALGHKKRIVEGFLEKTKPRTVWDLGANVGFFSRLASSMGAFVVSWDIDPAAVERNYLDSKTSGETNVLPLVVDLTNPSPSIGWENRERMSFGERGPVDLVMALALVHHLAISNNLPFAKIASFFHRICRWLIIEFVPKEDSRVRRLLVSREDIFTDYTQQAFELEFCRYFEIDERLNITDSLRVLYLMRRL